MAPRIPTLDRQVGIGAQQTAARLDPSMFAAAGMQLGGAADAVVQFVAARDKARNEADLLRAKAAASREMTNLQLEMEQDTDWRTMDQRFTEKARTIHDSVAENISDPSTKATFSMAFDEAAQSKMVAVRRRSWDLESNQSRADLDQVLADNARNAANATSPMDQARYIKDGLDSIKSMQGAGYINAEDAGKRSRKFMGDHDEVKVMGLINTDPGTAERNLSDPAHYTNLDPERRQRLYSQAASRADALESRKVREMEHAERMVEKAARKRGEALAKDGWDAFMGGKLTEDWLTSHKSELDGSDYRTFRKALSDAGERPDNATVYGGLMRRIYVDGADVRTEAMAAYERHDIRPTTLKSVLDENQSVQSKSGQHTPYERGKGYIAQAMRFSDLNPLPGQPQAMANALADFDTWNQKNPGATPEQAMGYAKDTVKGYSLINWQTMSTSMRTPLMFKGTRAEPDMESTKKALHAAYKSGQIDDSRLADELQLVNQWEEAVQVRRQAQADDGKGKSK